MRAGLRVGRGPRAVEAQVLREVLALCEAARVEPRLLARPVRIVVPSVSLRLHLGRLLVGAAGRALAGVEIHTLDGLAREILRRGGPSRSAAEPLFPILVRQCAREESWLREGLEGVADGFGAAVAGTEDLLDAGFEAAHAEILDERLAESGLDGGAAGGGGQGRVLARARALVRVAAATLERAQAFGVAHRSQRLAAAASLLARDPESALPARAVLVHGFAELTARGADLIEALVRHRDAFVFIDEPPDPTDPERSAPGAAFSLRLRERLRTAGEGSGSPVAAAPPRLHLAAFHAPGAHAEAREVASRVAALIAAGACPEQIGIVARRVSDYRVPLRVQLRRLGVPFSGVGEPGSAGGAVRRSAALFDLLRLGSRVFVDRWLDAAGGPANDRADLRLALRHLGCLRLEDTGRIAVPERALPLPVRRGLVTEEGADAAPARARRRSLPAPVLRVALRRAAAVRACVERWGEGALDRHWDRLDALLRDGLGWRAEGDCAALLEAVANLRGALPPAFPLSRDDFALLLERCLVDVGATPLGGRGGGVQVLNVMEARARTFEHLFLLGLNRDVFPRSVREDPLLPDALRRALADVLPDVPIKATGGDEERYLFAQLMAASPDVTLSWQRSGDDGRQLSPSALVERLRLGERALAVEAAPGPRARPTARSAHEFTAAEHALLAGLYAPRGFPGALRLAAEQACRSLGAPIPGGVAEYADARLAVLREVDAPDRGLGPYLGFVGASADAGDPRRAPLYVTAVEETSRCPWKAFLRRVLRVEAVPDPLEALPSIDLRLLGIAVHAVLDRIVRDAVARHPSSLDEALAAQPVAVPWPDRERFEALLREVAQQVLEAEGVALPGLAGVLAARARPLLERARALEWSGPDASLPVLASEIEDAAALKDDAGDLREVRFRADRVDRLANGALRLTDYKTGRTISPGVRAETRRGRFLARVEAGLDLQAAAYAAGGGPGARGRFLYLREDVADAASEFVVVGGDDPPFLRGLTRAVGLVTRAWEAGAFFPRLVEHDLAREARQCSRCEVAEACVRGDSGARRRLVTWLENPPRGEEIAPCERALREAWPLGGDV